MFEDVSDTLANGEADASRPGESESGVPPEPAEDSGGAPAAFAAETAAAGEVLPPTDVVDYKDRWLRAEAEMQNVRRRAARERDEAIQRAEDRVLLDLIELLDDLERALGALPQAESGHAWAQGVSLTAQRMRDVLARWGVTPVEAVGRSFDPNLHDALAELPAPEGIAPGAVAHEVLRGYRRGERTLRAARVVVARDRAEG